MAKKEDDEPLANSLKELTGGRGLVVSGASAEEDDGDEADPKRTMDAELKAMAALLRTLRDIPETARPRVVRWLSDRYASDEAR